MKAHSFSLYRKATDNEEMDSGASNTKRSRRGTYQVGRWTIYETNGPGRGSRTEPQCGSPEYRAGSAPYRISSKSFPSLVFLAALRTVPAMGHLNHDRPQCSFMLEDQCKPCLPAVSPCRTATFDRISRSILRWRFSRRRRPSSWRSAVVRPSARRPSSRPACATQLGIACAVSSNSRDSSSGLRTRPDQLDHMSPELRRIRTCRFVSTSQRGQLQTLNSSLRTPPADGRVRNVIRSRLAEAFQEGGRSRRVIGAPPPAP